MYASVFVCVCVCACEAEIRSITRAVVNNYENAVLQCVTLVTLIYANGNRIENHTLLEDVMKLIDFLQTF